MKEIHHGDVGWGLLAAGVIAWDVFAPETLSSAVDRYMETPKGRLIALGATVIVAAHLLNVLPAEYDPVSKLGNVIERVKTNG